MTTDADARRRRASASTAPDAASPRPGRAGRRTAVPHAARMVAALGVPVSLCVALGGEVGGVLAKLLADEDVTVRSACRWSGTTSTSCTTSR